jgi:hypothetical protein
MLPGGWVKWSVAEELWTKIREFYSCHVEIPGSREFVEECDVQINRSQKYGSLSANRHDRSNAKKEKKNDQPVSPVISST